MFYLGQFYKILLKKPLLAVCWLAALGSVLLSLFGQGYFHENLSWQSWEEKQDPYFYAVFPDKINSSYVQRKLGGLPGVEGVALLPKDKIAGHVKAVLDSTNITWDKDLIDLSYAGLKVSLSPDLKPRSQNLIRNYLSRLAGEKDVTMGALKKPASEKRKLAFTRNLKKSFLYIPLIFALLYLVTLGFLLKPLAKEAFLLETYQRKKNVLQKLLSFSQAPVLVLCVAAFFIVGHQALLVLGLLTFGLVFLILWSQRVKAW